MATLAPPTLTLEDVRRAGVVAWREDGTLFTDGALFRVHLRAPYKIQLTRSVLENGRSAHLFADGRQHLPGSVCEVCGGEIQGE